MNASQLHSRLTWIEVDSDYEPDCRRVLRDERMSLGMSLGRLAEAQRGLKSARYDHERAAARECISEALREVNEAKAEAERVAKMWGAL